MDYEVRLKSAAERQLKKIKNPDFADIGEVILSLRKEPWPAACKKLAVGDIYRIRIKHFRIVYEVRQKERVVFITKVVRRSETTCKELI